MENRLHLDREVDIPLGLIDAAPWNPKPPISGIYRRGLEGSLDTLGNRDRLHVWPRPDAPSRYYVLDGNQRLMVIGWLVMADLIREQFGLDRDAKESVVTAIFEDPENAAKIESIRNRSLSWPIPSQVVTQISEGVPFTLAHAKTWTLVWNRNHARFDETMQTSLYREVLADTLASTEESQRKVRESLLKRIVRPELPHVDAPPPKPDDSFQYAAEGEFTPTESEPWGPVPDPSPAASPSQSPIPEPRKAEQLVPMVFSFTQSGYREISDSILRCRSRLFMEKKLTDALHRLEAAIPDGLDPVIDSVIVETALRTCNLNLEAKSVDSK